MIQALTSEQRKLLNSAPYKWIFVRIGSGAPDATPAEAILFGHTFYTLKGARKMLKELKDVSRNV